jgi:DNA modification methylase
MPWSVIVGDSLGVMRGMAAGSVDAIVTSPPYADQRSYTAGEVGGRHSAIKAKERLNARSRHIRSEAPGKWAPWLEPYTAEMLRVLSPAGSLMLNVGVVLRDGEEHDCTDEILRRCRGQGWKVLHRMVWNKPNGQVPSSSFYLTCAHEFVFWLAPRTRPYRAFEQPAGSQGSREVRSAHHKQSAGHRLHPDGARPTTVYTCAVGGEPNPTQHPARMPTKLALHLVALCCPPGGLVLDPFAGNCTTGIAATRSGRRFVGVEIDPSYAEAGRRRLRDDDPALESPTARTMPLFDVTAIAR